MSSAILYSERAETNLILRQEIGYRFMKKAYQTIIAFCQAVKTP